MKHIISISVGLTDTNYKHFSSLERQFQIEDQLPENIAEKLQEMVDTLLAVIEPNGTRKN